ncbi:MAG: hypothetical protein ABR589_04875 [Chthoniobacterales bacterium]
MLPFRSGRSFRRGASAFFFLTLLCFAVAAAEPQNTPSEPKRKIRGAVVPGSIPLPIGHEIKGLVLPDYNVEGELQARFEATIAKRIDADRIHFTGMKMITFKPGSAPDLSIEMPTSTLDMKTRVLTSEERTTVTRADFQIAGDRMRFDTVARQGTLAGNVKMVISGQSHLMEKSGE